MSRSGYGTGIGLSLTIVFLGALCARSEDRCVIEEGFEGDLPAFHTYRAAYAADDTKAHGGKRCLRVTPSGESSGGAYFRLAGLIDHEHDYEFSAWVWAGKAGGLNLYISASDGTSRHTKGGAAGGVPGRWVRVTGRVRRQDWSSTDRDPMLAMVVATESWVDDVTLTATIFPPPPIETYPKLQSLLRSEADRRATQLPRGGSLRLDSTMGALAPDVSQLDVTAPAQEGVRVPADGFLTFAVDVAEATYARGTVSLEPEEDLRPGLRAYVLCDSTLIAAPMVAAPPWQGVGNAMRGAVPDCEGPRPTNRCELVECLLTEGRHYLTVAGPHSRGGGAFEYLELETLSKPVTAPLYQFALLADTHVGDGRSRWMNVKMNGPSAAELTATLADLAGRGTAFALIAGDMTDGATRDHFQKLGKVLGNSTLPVFGCAGNHDSYHATSRRHAVEFCGGLFPDGKTDYVLDKPPLRFLVLDGSYWKSPDGGFMDHYESGVSRGIGLKPEEIAWLRRALAEDVTTPTVIVWHYPVFRPGGVSSCGYKLPPQSTREPTLGILRAAPNVVATFGGHTHWNAVSSVEGITHVQNAAFVEWPNCYRVVRVYTDRMEWEVRQVENRGFVRESFAVDRALSWMISTGEHDLAGTISFTR